MSAVMWKTPKPVENPVDNFPPCGKPCGKLHQT
nr:MAG TPA: hypothetical protein [Caudoviricetes sp.]